jgi:hypothetical protein
MSACKGGILRWTTVLSIALIVAIVTLAGCATEPDVGGATLPSSLYDPGVSELDEDYLGDERDASEGAASAQRDNEKSQVA